MTKLIEVKPSNRKGKKYSAIFELADGKRKTTAFGSQGMSDFTIYSKGDKVEAEERKRLYLMRHKEHENWDDPTSAGACSRWLLWNKSTLEASITDFKRRFNL
jgi:hypothetical protein